MKTLSDYSIPCTEAQTKKALELGAPIEEHGRYHADLEPNIVLTDDKTWLEIPTAEQLINWLRKEKGFKFLLSDAPDSKDDDNWWLGINGELISSGNDEVKELAAIDAALEYLSNNKK